MKIEGGVRLTGCITPNDTTDTYPTHDSQYGKGGYREVQTIEDRNNITLDRRKLGMLVYVIDEDKTYRLKNIFTNAGWEEVPVGVSNLEYSEIVYNFLDKIVAHNLNKNNCGVTVIDLSTNETVECSISYIDENTVRVVSNVLIDEVIIKCF